MEQKRTNRCWKTTESQFMIYLLHWTVKGAVEKMWVNGVGYM